MFCKKCGAEIDNDALFCTNCGAKVKDNAVIRKTTGVNTNVKNTNAGNMKREKVFTVKQTAGIANLGAMTGAAVVAIVWFYECSQLSEFFYSAERMILFMLGVMCGGLALVNLAVCIELRKARICVGDQSISGVSVRGVFTREFEYFYDEISEVRCIFGTLLVRADGKFIPIPGIENKEMARKMIEERIEKF